jgi:hypothetical protein
VAPKTLYSGVIIHADADLLDEQENLNGDPQVRETYSTHLFSKLRLVWRRRDTKLRVKVYHW